MPSDARHSARSAVFTHLARQVEAFPRLRLEDPPLDGLDARDAALAVAISDTVVSRWLTLEYILARFVRGEFLGLEPRVRAGLLAGAAQILFMDRIPAHAAIHETVELAKRLIRPGAGALVNAVLRRVADLAGEGEFRESWTDACDELARPDGRARVLREAILPVDARVRLEVVTSHAPGLLARLGLDEPGVRGVALHSLVVSPTLLSVVHAQDARAIDADPRVSPHDEATHRVFEGDRASLAAWLGANPGTWVQDPGSSAAVAVLADLRPGRIMDLCAGQGTKTRQLARVFPEAVIIATDVDARRRRTLRASLSGEPRVRVVEPGEVEGVADLILLDVPCSNTGVLARRREAKYRLAETPSLVQTQREIVRRAVAFLARGGRIAYSTCSLLEEENAGNVRWAEASLGLRVIRTHARWPRGVPGDPPSRYTDGSSKALLGR